MKEIGNRGLPAIIIDLHASDARKLIPLLLQEVLQPAFQFGGNLER